MDASLDRRDLLKSAGTLAIALATGSCEQLLDQIKNRPTRRSIGNLAANDPILQTYKDAIVKMKALPSSDGRNWTRQAQIHNDHCPHQNWFFLPWHRAYLLAFERIIRELTGNKTFALPYWNWANNLSIPDVFWGGNSNPMFDGNRVLGQGMSLDPSMVGHGTLESIQSEPNFLLFASGAATQQRQRTTYGSLEGTPHNYVHGAIGGDMGAFMSPLDPIFWTHHNMIDYCWVDWNLTRQHDNTNDASWYNFEFTDFFDENGAPLSVKAAITLLYPILSYQFEASQIGNAITQSLITKVEAESVKAFVQKGAKVEITKLARFANPQRFTLAGDRIGVRSVKLDPGALRTVAQGLPADQRLLLTIGAVEQPSEADYYVRAFVNLPAASAATPITDPHYAGSFAFFLGDHGGHEEAALPGSGFVIDVTPALRRLNQAGMFASLDKIDLSFVPVPLAGRQRISTSFSAGQLELALSRVTSK